MLFNTSKGPHAELKVVAHRPRFVLLVRALLVVVCFGLWTVGFFTGQWYMRSPPVTLILKEREHLLSKIVEYRKRVADMEIALAQKKVEVDIASSSSSSLRNDYSKMLEKVDELEEQVAHYQRVLKPNTGEQGLVMGLLDVVLIDDNLYRFSIDFFQAVDRKKLAGSAKIEIIGMIDGKEERYDFAGLAAKEPLELKLGFIHYQTLEGQISLPDRFEPSQVIVTADFQRGKSVTLRKEFSWTVRESSDDVEQR